MSLSLYHRHWTSRHFHRTKPSGSSLLRSSLLRSGKVPSAPLFPHRFLPLLFQTDGPLFSATPCRPPFMHNSLARARLDPIYIQHAALIDTWFNLSLRQSPSLRPSPCLRPHDLPHDLMRHASCVMLHASSSMERSRALPTRFEGRLSTHIRQPGCVRHLRVSLWGLLTCLLPPLE